MTARFTDQRKDDALPKMRYDDRLHVDRSWLHAAGALTRKAVHFESVDLPQPGGPAQKS